MFPKEVLSDLANKKLIILYPKYSEVNPNTQTLKDSEIATALTDFCVVKIGFLVVWMTGLTF